MRLIDVDLLEKEIYKWMPKDMESWADGPIPPIEDLVVSIMMTIQEQPTVNQWIPVNEQLPENKSPVIVTCDGLIFDSRVVALALYDDKTFFNFDGQKIGKVYAWQKLPLPYKGGKEQ